MYQRLGHTLVRIMQRHVLAHQSNPNLALRVEEIGHNLTPPVQLWLNRR